MHVDGVLRTEGKLLPPCPQLNLHRACVRRTHGRPRSNVYQAHDIDATFGAA